MDEMFNQYFPKQPRSPNVKLEKINSTIRNLSREFKSGGTQVMWKMTWERKMLWLRNYPSKLQISAIGLKTLNLAAEYITSE